MQAVIRFLNTKQKNPTEIHREIVEVYSGGEFHVNKCPCGVESFFNQFEKGRTVLFNKECAVRYTIYNAENEHLVKELEID